MRIQSRGKMSNGGFHRCGSPHWWARIGQGTSAQFLRIDRVRGDQHLDIEVEVPADVETIYIGCGKGKDGIRETISVTEAQ